MLQLQREQPSATVHSATQASGITQSISPSNIVSAAAIPIVTTPVHTPLHHTPSHHFSSTLTTTPLQPPNLTTAPPPPYPYFPPYSPFTPNQNFYTQFNTKLLNSTHLERVADLGNPYNLKQKGLICPYHPH